MQQFCQWMLILYLIVFFLINLDSSFEAAKETKVPKAWGLSVSQ